MDGNLAKSISSKPNLSIIVPLLNESEQLLDLLEHLRQWQQRDHEIILVDGGSTDNSVDIAESHGFKVLHAPCGRAVQMNFGAKLAKGSALLFLHADTRLPNYADEYILKALQYHPWGRFDVHITGANWMLNVISFFINIRSRLTGIATGDQAIFIKKDAYIRVSGFPEQPLMEDVEISKRLKKIGKPSCLKVKVETSGRRWLTYGVWTTIWLMWKLRFDYWRGVDPKTLFQQYY
jgi:rSAM/selenodomain-associated transferase 2